MVATARLKRADKIHLDLDDWHSSSQDTSWSLHNVLNETLQDDIKILHIRTNNSSSALMIRAVGSVKGSLVARYTLEMTLGDIDLFTMPLNVR